MGFGMASHLVKTGHHVTGYDVHEPTCVRFREAGGNASNSPREAALGAKILICMVTNSQQAESVLFDSENGAVDGILPMFSTISRTESLATLRDDNSLPCID